METLGLKDVPLEKIADESLGLKHYAEALTDFIRQCDSPLTIALQGDWGSGKTSLMNLIKEELEQENNNFKIIWFNTWQYSQFDMQDDLAISLVTHFIDEIGGDEGQDLKNLISQITPWAKVVIAAALKFAAGKVGDEAAAKAFSPSSDIKRPALLLKELKDKLKEMVINKVKSRHFDKVVVFVDDLDRLVPLTAVELLEVFKIFLDISGCVYILACDYNVVIQGLKVKFGLGEGDLKGKNFFDKIIQLPFNMPVSAYEANNYVDKLLTRINVDHDKQDTAQYVEMISYSIGFNPRNIKRLFNSLLLIKMVAEKKNLLDDASDKASKFEKEKVLFGLLCLQMAYQPVYEYLQRIEIDQKLIESLGDTAKQQSLSNYTLIKKNIRDTDGSELKRLADFMKAFFEALQLKSDDNAANLSESELQNLETMLKLSLITSSTTPIKITKDDYFERLKEKIKKLGVPDYYLAIAEFFKAQGVGYQWPTSGGIAYSKSEKIKGLSTRRTYLSLPIDDKRPNKVDIRIFNSAVEALGEYIQVFKQNIAKNPSIRLEDRTDKGIDVWVTSLAEWEELKPQFKDLCELLKNKLKA